MIVRNMEEGNVMQSNGSESTHLYAGPKEPLNPDV